MSFTLPNELLWFGFALFDLAMTVLVYRYFGRAGLFGYIGFSLVVCNIQVMKTVSLFGLTTTLGNVLYAGTLLVTDILGEFYGKKEAQRAVMFGFVCLVLASLYFQISVLYKPAESDFIQPYFEVLFGFLPRLTLASLLAYLCSQLHDVWAFEFWRTKTHGRMLWLRSKASSFVSQLLDSLIFCAVAFIGVFPWPVFWEIVFTTYVMKILVNIMDTPFIYMARNVHKRRVALGIEEEAPTKDAPLAPSRV